MSNRLCIILQYLKRPVARTQYSSIYSTRSDTALEMNTLVLVSIIGYWRVSHKYSWQYLVTLSLSI